MMLMPVIMGFTVSAQKNVQNSQNPPSPASPLTFTCGSTVTDVDNNTYNTLQIGTLCWLKENLKVTKNPAGQGITRRCYDDNTSNCDTYGGLYDWATIMNGASSSTANPSGVQGICPNGWHIPSYAEFTQLSAYANSQAGWLCNSTPDNLGKALASTTNWTVSFEPCWPGNNQASNNASGFTGMPGGEWLNSTSGFFGINIRAFWWSSTQSSANYVKTKWISPIPAEAPSSLPVNPTLRSKPGARPIIARHPRQQPQCGRSALLPREARHRAEHWFATGLTARRSHFQDRLAPCSIGKSQQTGQTGTTLQTPPAQPSWQLT
jgi:uncharacterized protein (TIGR02145 family)